MTIMLRERSEIDFVDLKGKTINDFYLDSLDLPADDAAAFRVVSLLDRIVDLPKFASLKEGGPMTFQLAFHFAVLVDSLDQGLYTNEWKQSIVEAFLTFKQEVSAARLHHRENRESLPHYERFGRLLSGSGSDTAEVIRIRHLFLLSEMYPKIHVVTRDPNRGFDLLEREVIWNRDRGQCQNPNCIRPDHKVAFRDATIHHIIEHSAGGGTTLKNGILICPECHVNRASMQSLTSHFQDYIARVYSRRQDAYFDASSAETPFEDADESSNGREGIKITIAWGALDIDRPVDVIRRSNDTETIIEFLRLLLETFKKPIRDQLMEFQIVRFPLSANPMTDFINRSQNRPFSYKPIPGTDLYFCPHSGRSEKVDKLRSLLSRLTLPDGGEFPEDCVNITIENAE